MNLWFSGGHIYKLITSLQLQQHPFMGHPWSLRNPFTWREKSGHTLFQKNFEENSHIGEVALLINNNERNYKRLCNI